MTSLTTHRRSFIKWLAAAPVLATIAGRELSNKLSAAVGKSTANVYELRLAQFRNLHYAAQGRASSLNQADLAEARFKDDQTLSAYYNDELAGGKWKGFQTQAKLGYGGPYPNSSWQQPPRDQGFPWSGRSSWLQNCSDVRTELVSRSAWRSSCSTFRYCWPIR